MFTHEEYYTLPRIDLVGSVDDSMVRHMRESARALNPTRMETKRVLVTLSSAGGYVNSARSISEEFKILEGAVEDVTLFIIGTCMSAAVSAAMGVRAENRLATPNTKFYLHESNGEFPEVRGPLSQRRAAWQRMGVDLDAEEVEADYVYDSIAKGCGQSREAVERVAETNIYLRGQDAVRFGLVSAIIDLSQRTTAPDLHLVADAN